MTYTLGSGPTCRVSSPLARRAPLSEARRRTPDFPDLERERGLSGRRLSRVEKRHRHPRRPLRGPAGAGGPPQAPDPSAGRRPGALPACPVVDCKKQTRSYLPPSAVRLRKGGRLSVALFVARPSFSCRGCGKSQSQSVFYRWWGGSGWEALGHATARSAEYFPRRRLACLTGSTESAESTLSERARPTNPPCPLISR